MSAELLTGLLRDVSRSFYLTLRVLPSPVRRQIAIAYLLARATDTIADTEIVKLPIRLDALNRLRARIEGADEKKLEFGGFAQQQGSHGERALLQRIEEALWLHQNLEPPDRELVKEVLRTITAGQELDLQRFGHAAGTRIIALKTNEELDDYTYRVAGCVGEFWTKMCLAHLNGRVAIPKDDLIAKGIRFGKGLQLVNILRDISADLLKGRCYIPEPALAAVGLKPADLAKPAQISHFRPLFNGYLQKAEDHLAAGWEYTNALPFSWPRVRLACAWPILIGLRTISHLRIENPLDGARRVKASRWEVKKLILVSLAAYSLPPLWDGLYKSAIKPRTSRPA